MESLQAVGCRRTVTKPPLDATLAHSEACARCPLCYFSHGRSVVSEPAQRDSSGEPLESMAGGPDSTQVPLPEDENNFDLFGPADTAGAGGTGQSQQPVPPGPAQ